MKHKSDDYKLTAVQYYLVEDKTQKEVCKIFKCSPRSLMRWVDKYIPYFRLYFEDRSFRDVFIETINDLNADENSIQLVIEGLYPHNQLI
tara:strand:- start:52 stop:321 length:270 start_codon:yes stop_codon:yes gene_type:complete